MICICESFQSCSPAVQTRSGPKTSRRWREPGSPGAQWSKSYPVFVKLFRLLYQQDMYSSQILTHTFMCPGRRARQPTIRITSQSVVTPNETPLSSAIVTPVLLAQTGALLLPLASLRCRMHTWFGFSACTAVRGSLKQHQDILQVLIVSG